MGTLNFTSKTPRKAGFSQHERDLITLGGILSLAKLVSKPSTSSDRLEEGLGRIQNLAANALDFVHSILELSALGAGKIEPVIESIELLPIIQSVEVDLEELRNLKNGRITVLCDGNLSVQADPRLLNQVITNLLSNALKYTSVRGEVVLSAETDENHCRITIRNPKELSQAPVNEEARYRSYGFGLEIAEELLQAHRSELKLEDDLDWFNASFTLPLTK